LAENSWIKTGSGFPSGGLHLTVRYNSGSKSSHLHLAKIGAFLSEALGCPDLFRGSLSLLASEDIELPEPRPVDCGGEEWLFVPVVIAEKAVGLVARRPPPISTGIIEVFACRQLAPVLGLKYGDDVEIRLLSGSYVVLAA
jgi:hypothetical protein